MVFLFGQREYLVNYDAQNIYQMQLQDCISHAKGSRRKDRYNQAVAKNKTNKWSKVHSQGQTPTSQRKRLKSVAIK